MRKIIRLKNLLVLLLTAATLLMGTTAYAATDKTTKYRVYQNEHLLLEFSDYDPAVQYAKQFTHSHVEEIATRNWLWDNYPQYIVYQYDTSLPHWEFNSLDAAKSEARKWGHAAIRDTASVGWVWNNYPNYRLYQGDNTTLSSWEFATLQEAQAEAKKWSHAHIIDLNNNRWVWDNYSADEKKAQRSGPAIYQVYQRNYTQEEWRFSTLEEAIKEALKWSNSTIINLATNKTVYYNLKEYEVVLNGVLQKAFVGLHDAIAYASTVQNAAIQYNNREIWSNVPYYQVVQSGQFVAAFTTIPEAVKYASQIQNVSIKTNKNNMVWDNLRKLLFLGWNGGSSGDTIRQQVAGTQGLDIVSPTWFQLADAAGTLSDTSSSATALWLKQQNFKVYPLVTNQFNPTLTTAFLIDLKAQSKFIDALTSRLVELGLPGVNIDFESVSGKDRDALTEFMRKLTDEMHKKGLKVSMDLYRGSVAWNHLTAFDHEKLGQIVDYMIIMGYDQFYSGSESAGPVSGLPWAEGGVKEFLSYGIPRDKLILGIPFYVRDWTIASDGALLGTRAIYMKNIPILLEGKSNVTAVFDEKNLVNRISYVQDGQEHVFWEENEATIKARIDIAKKYDIAGVAFWRLGYEPADLWKMMIQQK